MSIKAEIQKAYYRQTVVVKHREALNIRQDLFEFRKTPPVGIHVPTKFDEWSIPKAKMDPTKTTNEIFLKDMDTSFTAMYKDRYIEVRIIDDPLPCILRFVTEFVIEDKNKDVGLLSIYNLPDEKTCGKKFGFGTKIRIQNPSLMLAYDDHLPEYWAFESEKITHLGTNEDMCRFCGDEDGAKVKCGGCPRRYCDQLCRMSDWNHLKHDVICKIPFS